MLILQNPEYKGIQKIISGGQCGADFGGLLAAESLNIPTGGWAPKGYRTHFGPRPDLQTRFNLCETQDFGYRTRTIKNVKESDGTLIIAFNLSSPGCLLTSNSCTKLNKPCLQIKIDEFSDLDSFNLQIVEWFKKHEILTLNIAGNRDKVGNLLEQITCQIVTSSVNLLNKYLHEPI